MPIVRRALAGLILGYWFIAGTAMWAGGILMLAMQIYAWLAVGLWLPITLREVCRMLEIPVPTAPWIVIQPVMDLLLSVPASGVFVLCGLLMTYAVVVARRNMERRSLNPLLIVAVDPHRASSSLGITSLHIRGK